MAALNSKPTAQPQPIHRAAFTVDLIMSAKATADAGNLVLAADLAEYVTGDDRVSANIGVRVDTLLGSPIVYSTLLLDNVTPEQDPVILALSQDYSTICEESELRSFLMRGWICGWSPGELVWVQRNGREIPTIRPIHPRNLKWDWAKRTWLVTVSAGGKAVKDLPFTPGDGRWVLFTPYGSDRPWASGLWKSLAFHVLGKELAWADWQSFSERHGNATTLVENLATMGAVNPYSEKSTIVNPEIVQQIIEDLSNVGRNGVYVAPQGHKVSFLEPTSSMYMTFKDSISTANEAISVLAIGQTLTSTVGPQGSLAAAEVHREVSLSISVSDASQFETFLRDQVLIHWARVNFGDPERAPWARYRVVDSQAVELARKAASLQMLSQALAPLMSAPAITPGLVQTLLAPYLN